jgi:hypothetical protein
MSLLFFMLSSKDQFGEDRLSEGAYQAVEISITVLVLGLNLLMFAALVLNFLLKAFQKKKLSTELKGVVADLKAAAADPHYVLPCPEDSQPHLASAAPPNRSSKVVPLSSQQTEEEVERDQNAEGHRYGHGHGHGGEHAHGGEHSHFKEEEKGQGEGQEQKEWGQEREGVATVEGGGDDLTSLLERGLQEMEDSTLSQLEGALLAQISTPSGGDTGTGSQTSLEADEAEQLALSQEKSTSDEMEQGNGKGKRKHHKGRHRHGHKTENDAAAQPKAHEGHQHHHHRGKPRKHGHKTKSTNDTAAHSEAYEERHHHHHHHGKPRRHRHKGEKGEKCR